MLSAVERVRLDVLFASMGVDECQIALQLVSC